MEESKKDFKDYKLGEILLEWGFLDQERLAKALEIQKTSNKRLGKILVEKGMITEQQLIEALAQEHHLPVINLANVEVDEKVLNLFSFQILKRRKVLPIELKGGYLLVAIENPLEVATLQELRYI